MGMQGAPLPHEQCAAAACVGHCSTTAHSVGGVGKVGYSVSDPLTCRGRGSACTWVTT